MSAADHAIQLWKLLNKASFTGDRLSREQIREALGCSVEELDEAIETLRRMLDNFERRLRNTPPPPPDWVPFAERKPSKEIRRLLFFG